MPITGTSMNYSFDAPDEPTRKHIQYFEMMGHRGLYRDGWKAVTRHDFGSDFDNDRWELYNLNEDRSECKDLAESHPEMLAELIELWWSEAEEHGVLPLDDRTIELFGARFRDRSPHPESRHYTYYPPMNPLPAQVSPGIGGRSWDMDARIDRPAGANGVLYATGTENSGLSLFVKDDLLVFDYNCFGEHHIARSDRPVPTGPSSVGVRFRRDGDGGIAHLVIDGTECGTVAIPFAMRVMSSVGPSVGYDHGSPVSEEYTGHFPFEGAFSRLDVQLVSPSDEKTDAAEARAEMGKQ
jgi:arylsulfatase